ncbi:MAG: hypothetical protein M1269_06460 [Chloroflexi bacterium]|nr:hypothetical protein [Chloroflexota bacterium]
MKKFLIIFFGVLFLFAGCSSRVPVNVAQTGIKPINTPTPLAQGVPPEQAEEIASLAKEKLKIAVAEQKARIKSGKFMFNAIIKKENGIPSFQKGPVTFRLPGNFRMDLEVDNQMILVLYYKGCAYSYDPARNTLTKFDIGKLPKIYYDRVINSNPVTYFLGHNIDFNNVKIAGTEKFGGKECYVITIAPARINWMEDAGEIASEKVWICGEDGLSYKVVLLNPAGRTVMTYEYGGFVLNPASPDSLFAPDKRNVPENATIYDITDNALKQIEKTKETEGKKSGHNPDLYKLKG